MNEVIIGFSYSGFSRAEHTLSYFYTRMTFSNIDSLRFLLAYRLRLVMGYMFVTSVNNGELLKPRRSRGIKLAPSYWRLRPNFRVRGFTGLESL